MATPLTLPVLEKRAKALAGRQLKTLISHKMPNTLPDKGIIGQLLEILLETDGGTLPQPDFTHLGIELKTLPIIGKQHVKESTFVCMASLLPEKIDFFESLVYRKLQHVLFIPYEAEKEIPILERHIGTPFFWQPNPDELSILKHDYDMLMQAIIMGEITGLRAKQGQALQIRPKGQNRKALTQAIDSEGETLQVNARGFYLRQQFTQRIISQRF